MTPSETKFHLMIKLSGTASITLQEHLRHVEPEEEEENDETDVIEGDMDGDEEGMDFGGLEDDFFSPSSTSGEDIVMEGGAAKGRYMERKRQKEDRDRDSSSKRVKKQF